MLIHKFICSESGTLSLSLLVFSFESTSRFFLHSATWVARLFTRGRVGSSSKPMFLPLTVLAKVQELRYTYSASNFILRWINSCLPLAEFAQELPMLLSLFVDNGDRVVEVLHARVFRASVCRRLLCSLCYSKCRFTVRLVTRVNFY